MIISTTVRSPGAIGLGALFAFGTLYVLMEDVIKGGAAFTTDHLMTLLVLVGTIAAGHMLYPQLRAWRLGASLGLAVLFTAGTWYVVTTSAGRNAVVSDTKAAVTSTANVARQSAQRDVNEARARHAAALEAETSECATGAGPKCTAKRQTTSLRRHDLEVADILLRDQPPELVTHADVKHAAKVFATLPWIAADQEAIEHVLLLWLPFLKALFLEAAVIVFLGIGLGHRSRRGVDRKSKPQPKPGNRDHVVSWVSEFRRRHGRDPQIPELQKQFKLPKTSAWRYAKRA